eukprot:7113889-Prymnesium_polylepis.1
MAAKKVAACMRKQIVLARARMSRPRGLVSVERARARATKGVGACSARRGAVPRSAAAAHHHRRPQRRRLVVHAPRAVDELELL